MTPAYMKSLVLLTTIGLHVTF